MATPSASVTIQTIPSRRAASPHPVTASAPKEFTVDCTMMLEIEYNDDWTASGRPVASMLRQMERSMPSRRGSSLHAPWARMSLTITIEALMVMVSAVAIPHPSASILNPATKMRSNTTLNTQPDAMMRAGACVSPTARSSAVPMLSTSENTMAPK